MILAGPSGCGKPTLLRSTNGLIPHIYSGVYDVSASVGGLDVKNTRMSDLAQKVGLLFQNPENQIFMFFGGARYRLRAGEPRNARR